MRERAVGPNCPLPSSGAKNFADVVLYFSAIFVEIFDIIVRANCICSHIVIDFGC